ncbi:MAG: hypothetical protein EOP19_18290, partial [Hyphomicrobiales bacterium]
MLLPIGNRKVKTGPKAAVLDCAQCANNLLSTINLLNAPESPELSGDLSGLDMGSMSALFKSDGSDGQTGGLLRLFLTLVLSMLIAAPALAQVESAVDDPRGGVSTLPEVLDARVTVRLVGQ